MRHNTKEQFLKDARRGDEGVKIVKDILLSKFEIKSEITDEATSKREHVDIRVLKSEHQSINETEYAEFVRKCGYKLEVKYDQTANRTGNLYFEIWSNVRLKPPNAGAITQCRAHSIWYVLDDQILVFDKAALLSSLITHFYFNTKQASAWRVFSSKAAWKDTVQKHIDKCGSFVDKYGLSEKGLELTMMPSAINHDVRGILIPVEQIKQMKEEIGLAFIIPR